MGGCKCSRTDCQACQRRRESARVRSAICRKKKKSATVPSTKVNCIHHHSLHTKNCVYLNTTVDIC
jgi:hypothetical protein